MVGVYDCAFKLNFKTLQLDLYYFSLLKYFPFKFSNVTVTIGHICIQTYTYALSLTKQEKGKKGDSVY